MLTLSPGLADLSEVTVEVTIIPAYFLTGTLQGPLQPLRLSLLRYASRAAQASCGCSSPCNFALFVCSGGSMRLFIRISVIAVGMLVSAGGVCAQKDLLVPAGTLLQCTMNEPDFSSATATVGDPVLCHLRTQQEFGKVLFPRGSMLGGHLEAEKEPGHFIGKGYLKITFDRVILPYGDLPVPAKMIQAKGFKVDKKGDIDGKGHAKRDVAEWMVPPLWPWKVISLPMRGPRPTLRGEEPLELRLMDDISFPATMAYGPMKPDRPPYASEAQPMNFNKGSAGIAEPP